jgi:ketosteroid isomerase-like protein
VRLRATVLVRPPFAVSGRDSRCSWQSVRVSLVRPPEQEVIDAARRRAAALATRDEQTLRLMLHPDLQWTTYRGEVLGYEEYIEGNIGGGLVWHAQRLEDIRVVVVGDTAVLTASVTDEVQRDGHDQVFILRLTQTWLRTSEGWRCLAGHASSPVA